ncbi:MAG TPA: class I SAM-dependent methyltransferase [Thermoleophilaceae bacterium]|nr:class I SAM-dependent methyltransferase [Thermoleophilaceae bacterium]
MESRAFYDDIGRSYTVTRQEEPKLAAVIWAALGDARSVLNVGAGTGSYEPRDREVLALEPSDVMIAQRPEDAAPVIKGSVEAIPLRDASVDAAMAVLSDHHWKDRRTGMREMRRVARKRVVLFTADPTEFASFWFVPEYLPEYVELIPPRYREPGVWERELRMCLGMVRIEPVPIPHDCVDGFFGAYWRRPHAFLDKRVRDGISVFQRVPAESTERAVAALSADLESGAWDERHRDLLERDELEFGYRLVVAEFD